MSRHVGASFALSVLVVGFFAIVLYQPEPEPLSSQAPGSLAPEPVRCSPAAPAPRAHPASGVPLPEIPTTPAPSAPEIPVEPSPGVSEATPDPPEREAKVAIPSGTPPRVGAVSRTRAVPAPRSAFTVVGDGESLDDVALRVYGTREESRRLWRANRDLIDRKGASLRAGMLLRTP